MKHVTAVKPVKRSDQLAATGRQREVCRVFSILTIETTAEIRYKVQRTNPHNRNIRDKVQRTRRQLLKTCRRSAWKAQRWSNVLISCIMIQRFRQRVTHPNLNDRKQLCWRPVPRRHGRVDTSSLASPVNQRQRPLLFLSPEASSFNMLVRLQLTVPQLFVQTNDTGNPPHPHPPTKSLKCSVCHSIVF